MCLTSKVTTGPWSCFSTCALTPQGHRTEPVGSKSNQIYSNNVNAIMTIQLIVMSLSGAGWKQLDLTITSERIVKQSQGIKLSPCESWTFGRCGSSICLPDISIFPPAKALITFPEKHTRNNYRSYVDVSRIYKLENYYSFFFYSNFNTTWTLLSDLYSLNLTIIILFF